LGQLEQWKAARQACRTNLYYLCQVLGYTDVQPKVHGPLVANLQSFPGGVDGFDQKVIGNLKANQTALPTMKVIRESYQPTVSDLWGLQGPRQRLNMIPRGHLKTTVATVAHSIQWIINYPNVRILLFTHSDGKAKDFLGMIKNHFIQNETFRYLFPEHVPWGKKVNDFGNQEKFDTLARTKWIDKESTVQFLTIDSAKAGGHFDVVKADDVVDETNVITVDRIASVKKAFAALEPLVDKRESDDGGQKGWLDLTGTFYDFSDLNYSTCESEKEKPEEARIWALNVQSAAPNYPDGPYLWPERFGLKILKAIEDDPTAGPAVLAAQYLMNPIPPGSGLIETADEIIWTPRRVMNELYARLSLHVAVDCAGMDTGSKSKSDNDYTCMTLGGFGTDGHVYVPEILHGRFSPEQVINFMFDLYKRHPRIVLFKIEKEAHARVLLKFLKAEEAKRNVWLPIMEIQRDNQQSKQQKIRGLQPWFKRGMIHFADDLPCKTAIINEIMRFPKFNHDDILDTLCDLMASRDGGVTAEVMGDRREHEQGKGSYKVCTDIMEMFGNPTTGQYDELTGWPN
jgi:predicted phage terminase large subunit-like protein